MGCCALIAEVLVEIYSQRMCYITKIIVQHLVHVGRYDSDLIVCYHITLLFLA